MTRNGEPIEKVGIRDAVNPHIAYSQSFAEWEAASAANLDLWRWEQPDPKRGYPKRFKARVLVWHKYHVLIQLHTQDAIARHRPRKG